MKRPKFKVRPKALFGLSESAAILTAAGMQTAATAAAAVQQATATKRAAEQQAKSIEQNAKVNADALAQQNENNNELQKQNMEFIKAQNEKNRQLQQDVAMNLQMLAGKESMGDRMEQSKIQVAKYGGHTGSRFRLRDLGMNSSLQGGNMPFAVTDGGGVIPIGKTPEGYDMYEIVGNDHNHYHKTKQGKWKSGVGIKFANGKTIEGEGNQKGNNGEILVVTPDDAMFLSKHSMNGFNPTNAVKAGYDPVSVFDMQERIKRANNIKSDGSKGTPVESIYGMAASGGYLNTLGVTPDLSSDIAIPVMVANGSRLRLRNGGRIKALVGFGTTNPFIRPYLSTRSRDRIAVTGPSNDFTTNIGNSVKDLNSSTSNSSTSNNEYGFSSTSPLSKINTANLIGAGLTSIGNIAGSLIGNWANNKAANALSAAYDKAAQYSVDAYNRMHGIDTSWLTRDSFDRGQALAAVRSASYNINPQVEEANRYLRTQTRGVNNSTMSSAARLARLNRLADATQQQVSNLYATKGNKEEQIKQSNIQQINAMASENANRRIQANNEYTNAMLNMLQYNNDIENNKLAGIAEAQTSGLLGGAQARAQAHQTNGNLWANALASTGSAFGNVFNDYAKTNGEILLSSVGMDPAELLNLYIRTGNKTGVQNWLNLHGNKSWYGDQAKAANDFLSKK